MNKEKTQPAHEVRLNHIRATVWENVSKDGKRWFNTTLTRRYQDGDDWKDANTFNGQADLVLAQEALRQAQAFIARAEAERGTNDND